VGDHRAEQPVQHGFVHHQCGCQIAQLVRPLVFVQVREKRQGATDRLELQLVISHTEITGAI
jgi:hypothetical protein